MVDVTDKPAYIERLQYRNKKLGKKRIQSHQLIDHTSGRMEGLEVVYSELSEISRFGSVAFWAAFHLGQGGDCGSTRVIDCTSYPRFRDEEQALIACDWIGELAEISRHVLQEFAAAHLLPGDSTIS